MCWHPRIFHPVDERELLAVQDRSSAEYVVGEEEDVDAMIRRVTQPARTRQFPVLYNRPVLRFDAAVSDPVRQSLRAPFPRPSKTGLGFLNFPVEIICEIVRLLDIRSVLKFRQVNQRAREVVSAVTEYQRVVEFALDTVLAFHRVEVAHHVGLTDLYAVLCTDACSLCGELGRYIFMPTLKRCCVECVEQSSDFRTVQLTNREFKALQSSQNSSFRIVRTVRRVYDKDDNKFIQQRRRFAAIKALPEHCDRPKAADGDEPCSTRKEWAFRYSGRYACTTDLPVLEIRGAEVRVQEGLHCKGCRANRAADGLANRDNPFFFLDCSRRRPDRRHFSSRVYMEHFRWCASAQDIWISGEITDPED